MGSSNKDLTHRILEENIRTLNMIQQKLYPTFSDLLEFTRRLVQKEGITLKLTENYFYIDEQAGRKLEMFYSLRVNGVYLFKFDLNPPSPDRDCSSEGLITDQEFFDWAGKDVRRLIDVTSHIDEYINKMLPAVKMRLPANEYCTAGIKCP